MDEASAEYAKIIAYIDGMPAAVLSTIGEDGTVHGAVVYVVSASHHTLCFVTKTGTAKYKDVQSHPQVALTFFNERETSTLQISGQAYVSENDQQMISFVLDKIAKLHAMQSEWLPPVSKVENGEYAVIGIEIQSGRLTEFQGAGNSKTTTVV